MPDGHVFKLSFREDWSLSLSISFVIPLWTEASLLLAVELKSYGSKNLDGYGIHPNFHYHMAVVL
jgi:hypothetical protein